MSFTTILLAALLAGLGTFTMHSNGVSGGGPVGAPRSASVDSIIGGGPSGAPQPPSVDSIAGGGPVGAPHP